MKKVLIIVFTLLLTAGCTVVRIDTKSIDNIVDVVLSKDNKLYNQIGQGYKYYVPKGVTYIESSNYNDKLYSNGTYYYLYIDIINYYYKNELETDHEDCYYCRDIDINNKKGYITIKNENNQYYIKFVYNYAVLEAAVQDEKQINEVILNASYMLSTIKYNDEIVSLVMGEDFLTNREEEYDVFKSKGDTSNFLKYEEE